jgi:hypothetical protein
MLNVVMLSAMLCLLLMPNVNMLNVIMVSVVMLSVVGPPKYQARHEKFARKTVHLILLQF